MQKGTKFSRETIEKMRESALKRDNTLRLASLPRKENHWRWKSKPSKSNLHRRLFRVYGKAQHHKCFDGCGKQAMDWSNQKGNYTDKIEDYVPRCRSCHVKHDMTDERRNKERLSSVKRIRNNNGQFK